MRIESFTLLASAAAIAFAACIDVGDGVDVGFDSGSSGCFDTGFGSDTAADLRYADEDGDGYGDPDAALTGCQAPDDWVADNHDCNDGDGAVHPGADDACGDGVDQDCDGGDLTCVE